MSVDMPVADLRALWESTLLQTATITRPTDTPDGQGGYTQTWATVATKVPCKVQSLRQGAEVLVGERLTAVAQYEVGFKYDADVSERGRLTVGVDVYQVTSASNLTYDTGRVARSVKAAVAA